LDNARIQAFLEREDSGVKTDIETYLIGKRAREVSLDLACSLGRTQAVKSLLASCKHDLSSLENAGKAALKNDQKGTFLLVIGQKGFERGEYDWISFLLFGFKVNALNCCTELMTLKFVDSTVNLSGRSNIRELDYLALASVLDSNWRILGLDLSGRHVQFISVPTFSYFFPFSFVSTFL